MRKFKLINGNGVEWDLLRPDGFLINPAGLGYDKNKEYIRSGFYYIQTDDVLAQKAPSGEMVFNSYAIFREFVVFCATEPLTLLYKPANKWYKMRVSVKSLQKTELTEEKRLHCPVVFDAQSTWYETIISTAGEGAEIFKRYTYQYAYKYTNAPSGIIRIENGAVESPCKLFLFGEARNPTWILRQNGVEILRGKINTTVEDDSYLLVNAEPLNMEIATYDRLSSAYQDSVYADSDFSTSRFVIAPPGESELTITDDDRRVLEGYIEMERLCYAV